MTVACTYPTSGKPEFRFVPFADGCVEDVVGDPPPPFTTPLETYKQLKRVEAYAKHLRCKCILIEKPYIDRDHMEDHSAFYSRTLYAYPNYCTRIHFFTIAEAEVEAKLYGAIGAGASDGVEAFNKIGSSLSEDYLGFSVIKPLGGSPVGRTILRCLAEQPSDPDKNKEYRRCFEGCRKYKVHVLGVELVVKGLAFQQQDTAVSACATTAIWASLQKMADHEEVALPTPAQITGLASRFSLPFGRAMPSEGLSLDQMCQAIQAVGLAPSLSKAQDLLTARSYVYSAIKSGLAPILVIEHDAIYHAVVAVGMKLSINDEIRKDAAESLMALYIHDDRLGPYMRAELLPAEATPKLLIDDIAWTVAHIIAPVHPKNRLSFSGLRDAALHLAAHVEACGKVLKDVSNSTDVRFRFDYWFARPHLFIREQFSLGSTDADIISQLLKTVVMSRYVGVVRISGSWCGDVDLLIDTTANRRNARCLAVIAWTEYFPPLAQYLSTVYACPLISTTKLTESQL